MRQKIKTLVKEAQDRQLKRFKSVYDLTETSTTYIVQVGNASYTFPKNNPELFIESLYKAGI